jgi:hypothetical protein|tara:strand:- start:824 stop:1015 length:192 start_codon:yes stop_codon:yes gene_type:complete
MSPTIRAESALAAFHVYFKSEQIFPMQDFLPMRFSSLAFMMSGSATILYTRNIAKIYSKAIIE